MLKKKTIKEEDPDTGEVLTSMTRYDGDWKGILEGDAVILIKFGDEEILNTTIKIPSGKRLHVRMSMASVLADAPKKK